MTHCVGPHLVEPAAAKPYFFRDVPALRALKRLARRRLGGASSGRPLRVWVPQCEGGEDAYSAAICLLEALGGRWREISLQVFSTDSNEDRLSIARVGRYPADAVRGLSSEMLARFFIADGGHVLPRPFVREACLFVGHRLDLHPPFSGLDAIACRAALTTLPPAQRRRTLQGFHRALASDGVLLDATGAAAEEPLLFAPVGRGRSYAARGKYALACVDRAPAPEARLREMEEHCRILLSRTEDAILIRDAETDAVVEANEAASRLFGWSLPELLTMRGADLRLAAAAVRRPAAERRAEERLRLPHFRRKDGTSFGADVSSSFLMVRGRPCDLWMVRDAAARLRLASGVSREKEREVFVGELVHELRSPISVIRGSVETLSRGVRGARQRSTFLDYIKTHALRMGRLVDRMLDFSAAEDVGRRVEPTIVLLAPALWEIVGAFAPVAKRRGIKLVLDIPDDLAVLADPADIPHVFGNLIDNAVKFTPRGGHIRIEGRAEGDEGVLSVKDSGRGVPHDDLCRIFERFYRSAGARRTKGTGLGLAIVAGIVKANRGRVFAENDPAGGAIFRVALPRAAADARA